jgi:hypothetical protein
MRHDVDDCRAVMISVLERVSKNEFRSLRLWKAGRAGEGTGCWS